MTGCHSALTPTSVPSLCISVTRVLRHWPAPINQLGWLLAMLPRPTLPSLPLPPSLFDTPYLSALLISPLPACPSLVLHSGSAPHLHCGCQSAGRREELETVLSLACLRPCGHEVLPKESNQVSSCILVTPCLPFCLRQIASAIFKQWMVWITPLCESSTFSKCQGSLRSYFLYSVPVCNLSLSLFSLYMCVSLSATFFLPLWNENEFALGSSTYDRSRISGSTTLSSQLPSNDVWMWNCLPYMCLRHCHFLSMGTLSLPFSFFHRLRISVE